MDIFLAWHSKRRMVGPDDRTFNKLFSHYQAYIKQKLSHFTHAANRTGIFYISDTALKSNTPNLQRDNSVVSFLSGYPSGIKKLLAQEGSFFNKDDYLLKLYDIFNKRGFDIIKDISPPFTIGYIDSVNDSLTLVHDGLGYQQGFVYEDGNILLCSNKCLPILMCLERKPTVNNLAWKYYFKDDAYFPLEYTPFEQISLLGQGEIFHCIEGKVKGHKIDCFSDWLRPIKFERNDLLEYARSAFNDSIKEITDIFSPQLTGADLSGGRDTRVILSSLLHQNIDSAFRTVGDENSADTIVVSKLEKKYHLNVAYHNPSILDVDRDSFLLKINKFLKWQDGLGDFKSSKYLDVHSQAPSPKPHLSGLLGNIYRQPAGIYAKLKYRNQIKAYIKSLLPQKASILIQKDKMHDIGNSMYRLGRNYGLNKYLALDFYKFTDRARRWGSANSAVTFSGYLIPFITIGLMKSHFSLSHEDHLTGMLHSYIIEKNCPDLSKIPLDKDIIRNKLNINKTPYNENLFWRSETGKSVMSDILSDDHYIWESLLDRSEILSMWSDHLKEERQHGEFFWKVAGFYFWYNTFF